MKQYVLVIFTIGFLLGCDRTSEQQTVATAGAPPQTAEQITCEDPAPGYAWMPPGVSFQVDYHLSADRIYANKNNVERRQVRLELLNGNLQSVVASVVESMEAAGYTIHKRQQQIDGVVAISFNKKGYGLTSIIADPTVPEQPSNPEAQGLLIVDYPTGKGPEAAQLNTNAD